MEISIPTKIDGKPFLRNEMEEYLRQNMLSKNHMILRQFALKYFKLNPDYFLACPINVILHWVLDRMIDESPKSDSIKVVGEKFGLATARNSDLYKIKGFDPRGMNDEFMQDYTKLLANFISRKLANMPGENEGIRLEELNRYIEPNDDVYIPPPAPPGVTQLSDIQQIPLIAPIPQPMPITSPPPATRKSRSKLSAKSQENKEQNNIIPSGSNNNLTLELLVKSLRGELSSYEDKFAYLQDQIIALESRVITLEAKNK